MARIVVTGAAGFIGSHTVDALLRQGHQVVGVDNLRTGHRENLAHAEQQPQFTFVEGDISEAGVLDGVVQAESTSAIIHLAALVSVQDSIESPELNFQLNVVGTHRVAESARMGKVPRVVFASSAAIYGDASAPPLHEDAPKVPISPYGGAKLAGENLLLAHGEAFGFTVRCQRYFNVYGPRQDPASPYSGVISIFEDRFRRGAQVTIYGDGCQTRDFVSVHDVVRANVMAGTQPDLPPGVANICTGRGTSLLEIVDVFREVFPGASDPIHAEPRTGDIIHSRGSSEAAKLSLGFEAEISVREGLKQMLGA